MEQHRSRARERAGERWRVSTHSMDNGNGAVGHGVELVEAAGLEARGHEQHVAAGRDAVRQAHVEAHPAPALLVPRRLHLPVVCKGLGFILHDLGRGVRGRGFQGETPDSKTFTTHQVTASI